MRRLLVLLVLCGCGDDASSIVPDAATPDAAGGGAADAAAVSLCNPLVGDDCLTPFPSSFYLQPAATSTGVRIAIPESIMPVTSGGITIRPDRLNGKDGFSPATPFIVYFAAGIDADQLPTIDDLAASTEPDAPVQVIDWDSGARVPLFAELDANAHEGERQVLFIRPQVRLRSGARYVVALVGLRDAAGRPLAAARFASLRDGQPLPEVAALKPRYDEIFARLEGLGLPRARLTLAWDAITASDATTTGHLVAMRDEALAMIDRDELHWRLVASKDFPDDAERLREVTLAVQAPSYLAPIEEGGLMRFGADGAPRAEGTREFPVTVEIPRCAATAGKPLPIIIFGHGLFGTAAVNLRDPRLVTARQALCMVMAGTDFSGVSTPDVADIAKVVIPDLNEVYLITDRLQQAHVNHQVMTRLLKGRLGDDPALAVGDHRGLDGNELYYFGVSNGGVQGTTFLALSADVGRGVLNVPGCEWNLMMYRSTDFNSLYPVLEIIFPDALERQVLVASLQTEFDHSDPISFAPHLIAAPLPGSGGPKQVILQESIGDSQVSNIATRILARTLGVPGMGLVQRVHGIAEVAGPVPSAYTQWDGHFTPLPPAVNIPAASDNGAHGGIQGLPALGQQLQLFLRPDGQAVNTCGGPCDFPRL